MTTWWQVAGFALGLALGGWCGQMLLGLFYYWRSVETLVKWFKSIVMFLGGVGGGAAIVGFLTDPAALVGYVPGLGLGLLIGRFLPLPDLRSPAEDRERLVLAGLLPEQVPDRDLLIDLMTEPSRRVQHEGQLPAKELARRYEQALDGLAEQIPADDA